MVSLWHKGTLLTSVFLTWLVGFAFHIEKLTFTTTWPPLSCRQSTVFSNLPPPAINTFFQEVKVFIQFHWKALGLNKKWCGQGMRILQAWLVPAFKSRGLSFVAGKGECKNVRHVCSLSRRRVWLQKWYWCKLKLRMVAQDSLRSDVEILGHSFRSWNALQTLTHSKQGSREKSSYPGVLWRQQTAHPPDYPVQISGAMLTGCPCSIKLYSRPDLWR